MAKLSASVERWRPLVGRYFAPEDVDAALAIMQAESGGEPGRPSEYNKQGTEDSWGLFQVNIDAHGGSPGKWSDPETNIAYAAQLKDAAGNWRDWRNAANSLGLPVSGSGGQQQMKKRGETPQVISRKEVWLDAQGKEAGPPSAGVGPLNWGGSNSGATLHEFITYANGQIWARQQKDGAWGEPEYMDTDAQLGTQYRWEQGASPNPASQWSRITDPATGDVYDYNEVTKETKPLFQGKKTATKDPPPMPMSTTAKYYQVNGDNGPELRNNPNYVPPVPPPGAAPKPAKGATRLTTLSANGQVYTVQEVADGMGGWSVDPAYTPRPIIEKPVDPYAAGKSEADIANTRAGTSQSAAQTGYITAQTGRLNAETPGLVASQAAQTAYQQAQAAKLQRDVQPGAMKAIQDMYDSISAVQGMMEKGTMTPAEGSSYMEAFKANAMVALQGSTLWQMKTDQQAEDRNRADIGRQLLNQRLSSSSGIANSLLGLLGSVGGKLANIPGGVKFDPFGMAARFTDEQSGGQEVSDLVKALLGQLRPGQQAPSLVAPPQPAGSSPVMNAIIQMLAAQPDIARNRQTAPTYQGDSQGSTIGGQLPMARDGQTYGTQSPDVQASFQGMYGPDAALKWMIEHNAALGG